MRTFFCDDFIISYLSSVDKKKLILTRYQFLCTALDLGHYPDSGLVVSQGYEQKCTSLPGFRRGRRALPGDDVRLARKSPVAGQCLCWVFAGGGDGDAMVWGVWVLDEAGSGIEPRDVHFCS